MRMNVRRREKKYDCFETKAILIGLLAVGTLIVCISALPGHDNGMEKGKKKI